MLTRDNFQKRSNERSEIIRELTELFK